MCASACDLPPPARDRQTHAHIHMTSGIPPIPTPWTENDIFWNWMRLRVLVQNQHTRELIRAWKPSHKHNTCFFYKMLKKRKTRVAYKSLSPGVRVSTRYTDSASTAGDSVLCCLVPCVYLYARWESDCRWLRSLLLCLCDVFHVLINSLVCGFWKTIGFVGGRLKFWTGLKALW